MYEHTIVFIPSYQPENVLVVLAKALNSKGFKVLIVDDGSGEAYKDIFDKASEFAEVLHYMPNHGKGYALKYGYQYIIDNYKDYECVITADGDGQHHIVDIERVTDACITRKKVIIGDRSFDVKIPLRSKVGNDMSRFTQSLATYRFLHDNQCGLRAFPLSTLPEMINIGGNRYEYEMNVINYLLNKELPFDMLKVQTIYEEGNKSSHFRPVRDTILIQGVLLKNLLISILSFAIQIILAWVFNTFIFGSSSGVAPIMFDIEVSTALAFSVGLLFNIIVSLIAFRPKHPGKTSLRIMIYRIISLVGYYIGIIILTRLLSIHIALSYFIVGLLIIFPLYFLIKGAGLVIDSQRN